jgi:hypothetical protein
MTRFRIIHMTIWQIYYQTSEFKSVQTGMPAVMSRQDGIDGTYRRLGIQNLRQFNRKMF